MPQALVERLLQHTRFAIRSYLETPGLSVTILITLALGLGARLAKPQGAQRPVIYLNYWEEPEAQQSPILLVRAMDEHPERLAGAVGAAVCAGGREFAFWTRTIATQRDVVLTRERLLAGSAATFGFTGLAMAAVGLFGLLTHYVASRRAEIGIRLAIGAGSRDITRLLVGEVAGLFLSGGAAGVVLVLAASKAFASLLAGVAVPVPDDPWPIVLTVGLIALVSLAALWLPLRRATSIDPLSALRSE